MFKTPFSFDGRIRRTEFGLSRIIGFFVLFTGIFIVFSLSSRLGPGLFFLFAVALYVPVMWFLLAQGAKRCHDLGNSGWYQIIPFYPLWMLFQDGEIGENRYGLNPKGIGNEDSYDDQISEIGKSVES